MQTSGAKPPAADSPRAGRAKVELDSWLIVKMNSEEKRALHAYSYRHGMSTSHLIRLFVQRILRLNGTGPAKR